MQVIDPTKPHAATECGLFHFWGGVGIENMDSTENFRVVAVRPSDSVAIQLTLDCELRAAMFASFIRWLNPDCEVRIEHLGAHATFRPATSTASRLDAARITQWLGREGAHRAGWTIIGRCVGQSNSLHFR